MYDIPIPVRDALKNGSNRKNYRIEVYDAEDETEVLFTIENDSLVSETVQIDERMVTGKTLKFGLCQGSSLEFKYFNHPNINGKRIKVMLDVEYQDTDGVYKWYTMPMGWYDVDSCPMEFDTGIRKVNAFNKLKSDYLDKDAKAVIKELIKEGESGEAEKITLYKLIDELLQGFRIDTATDDIIAPWGRASLASWHIEPRAIYDVYYHSAGTQWIKLTNPLYVYTQTFRLEYIDFNDDDYYRFIVPIKTICDKVSVSGVYTSRDSQTYGKRMPDGQNIFQISNLVRRGIFQDITDAFTIKVSYRNKKNEIFRTSKNLILDGDVSRDKTFSKELSGIDIEIPIYISESSKAWDDSYIDSAVNYALNWLTTNKEPKMEQKLLTPIEKTEFTMGMTENLQDVTLRQLQSAVFEMSCQFGRLDRDTDLFSGLMLNNRRLYPSESLYPSNSLKPMSISENTNPSTYEKLWTDSAGIQTFKYLIITYTAMGSDGNPVEKVLQRTVHEHGTTNYNVSDNWLFKNLIWTEADVAKYADTMVELMRDVSWIPFDLWSTGLPYLDAGDEIEITNKEGTFTSYILNRKLKGIQFLRDEFVNGELDIF